MKKFLLLRNNKQTGPYSVEELEQMGLKAYDLIWMDGKSAAWRYPGEIDELKSFAPPVEEQPYDRFYKRPVEESKKEIEPVKTETKVELPIKPEITTTSAEPNTSLPKKSREYKRISVTMPSSIEKRNTPSEPIKQVEVQKPVEQPKPVEQLKPVEQTRIVQPVLKEPEVQVKPKEKVQVTAKRAAIADPYATDIYFPPKKTDNKRMWILAGGGVGVLGLIALGVFIGISIKKPVTKEAGKQETERVYRVSDTEGKASLNPLVGSGESESSNSGLIDSADKKIESPKQKAKLAINPSDNKPDSVSLPPVKPADSEIIAIKDDIEPEKKVPEKAAPNLGKLISISNNDFQVGPFGGISKLKLVVQNKSDYKVNLVVVELQYLKVNKEVFKTETIYFRDIDPNSSLSVDAPKSSRGNKINYKITLISSKDHLYHASND